MANLEQQTESIRHAAGLQVLRQADNCIIDVVQRATFVSAYVLNEIDQIWSRADIEGALYLVRRSTEPTYRLIILNRRNPQNLVEDVSPAWEISAEKHYIFFRVPLDATATTISREPEERRVAGLWFSDDPERVTMKKALFDVLSELSDGHPNMSDSPSDRSVVSVTEGKEPVSVPVKEPTTTPAASVLALFKSGGVGPSVVQSRPVSPGTTIMNLLGVVRRPSVSSGNSSAPHHSQPSQISGHASSAMPTPPSHTPTKTAPNEEAPLELPAPETHSEVAPKQAPVLNVDLKENGKPPRNPFPAVPTSVPKSLFVGMDASKRQRAAPRSPQSSPQVESSGESGGKVESSPHRKPEMKRPNSRARKSDAMKPVVFGTMGVESAEARHVPVEFSSADESQGGRQSFYTHSMRGTGKDTSQQRLERLVELQLNKMWKRREEPIRQELPKRSDMRRDESFNSPTKLSSGGERPFKYPVGRIDPIRATAERFNESRRIDELSYPEDFNVRLTTSSVDSKSSRNPDVFLERYKQRLSKLAPPSSRPTRDDYPLYGIKENSPGREVHRNRPSLFSQQPADFHSHSVRSAQPVSPAAPIALSVQSRRYESLHAHSNASDTPHHSVRDWELHSVAGNEGRRFERRKYPSKRPRYDWDKRYDAREDLPSSRQRVVDPQVLVAAIQSAVKSQEFVQLVAKSLAQVEFDV